MRIDFIDGLRAICAVFVLLDHAATNVTLDKVAGALSPGLSQATGFLGQGFWAVVVFIILSGYCLMLPVVHSSDLSLKGGTIGYLKRRARRILPPYYAALALSLLVIGLAPGLSHPTGHYSDSCLPAFSLAAMGSHLLLIQDLKPQWLILINGPMWSIAVEWQIYFVMPLLLLPVFRRYGWPGCITAGFLFAWLLRAVTHSRIDQAQPYFVGLFAIGMAAASLSRARSTSRPSTSWFWGCAGIALFVLNSFVQRLHLAWIGHHAQMLAMGLVGMSVGCILIMLSRQSNPIKDESAGLLLRLLESRPLVSVGLFSYSLYLIHFPILCLAYLGVAALPISPDARLGIMLFVVAPSVIAVVYLFHVVFERPFMSARAVQRRHKEAGGPSTTIPPSGHPGSTTEHCTDLHDEH